MSKFIAKIWTERVAEQNLDLKSNIFTEYLCNLRRLHKSTESVLVFDPVFVEVRGLNASIF